jgi:hypothetical protein
MFKQQHTVVAGGVNQQHTVSGATQSTFQHLAARLNLTAAKKAEDDEDKKKDAKADEKAEGDREDHKDEDDDDKKAKAEKKDEDGDNDEGDDKKKSKKSKSKAADDDKKDDDKDDKKEARAVDRRSGSLLERERIAEIILSPEANASNACYLAAVRLALKSNMTADEVLAILELNAVPAQAPAPKDTSARDTLAQRMAASPKPDIGVDGDGGSEPTLAQKIILAGKKRRGEI